LQDAEQQAEAIITKARQDVSRDNAKASRILQDAEQQAEAIITKARQDVSRDNAKASRILQEAEQQAEGIITKARGVGGQIISKAEEDARHAERTAIATLTQLKALVNRLNADILQIKRTESLTSAALEDFSHPAETYVKLQADLRLLREYIKGMVTEKIAIVADENQSFSELLSSSARQRQLIRNVGKLALRSFNVEAENIIRAATATNLETSLNKLNRAADAVKRMTSPLEISVDHDYQQAKAEELQLAVKVESARKMDREAERERRAELREQAKADAELQAQRERLEKEQAHYRNVLERVQAQGDEQRVEEIEAKLENLQVSVEDLDYRRANHRAGYVYVISNIGALGERMVKIGLTRRLDPMDRVRELGDASVPFGFDVHALFFAEDAVEVEAELHRRFSSVRVNRVNTRREFFYATPSEVREQLEQIRGDLLEFVERPEAEQYWTSVALAQQD
ncbi:DUF4041 domain-containing protein, partial [Rothia koreensis]|uniref:DUF4041 domain-containing protein n=1 Tax=Rothia koreensis TaxID=592378 RepID=UPI0037CA73EC